MDVEREIHALAAENIAAQYILTHFLYRLSRMSPELSHLVRQAFDDAANVAEQTAIHLGKAASPEHSVKAIRVIEEIRAVVLGNRDKPKHAV